MNHDDHCTILHLQQLHTSRDLKSERKKMDLKKESVSFICHGHLGNFVASPHGVVQTATHTEFPGSIVTGREAGLLVTEIAVLHVTRTCVFDAPLPECDTIAVCRASTNFFFLLFNLLGRPV